LKLFLCNSARFLLPDWCDPACGETRDGPRAMWRRFLYLLAPRVT
jgi:hypothetical protein